MSKRKRTQRLLLLGLSTLLSGGALFAVQDRQLKDSDLKKLGASLGEYIEARLEEKGIFEAQESVSDELAKLEKKLKADPLSSPADVGYAYWLSLEYAKKKVKKGKIEEYEEYPSAYGPIDFAVWAPKKYDSRQPYAMILAIPSEDETPAQHIMEQWADGDLRDNVIIACAAMPEDRSIWSAPGSEGTPGGLASVLTTMKAVTEDHAVDYDRVYLAGRGLGVEAALDIAAQFPDRFAGVIGRSGDAGDTAPDNFRNLPTFFAGGGGKATAFEAAAKALGYDNVTLMPEGKEPDVWTWMQQHPRVAVPDKVTLVPPSRFATAAYWLKIPPSDGDQRIEAEVDRGTNTITITGAGVNQVTLFFNDALVNLDEPVKVVCNGTEHIESIPRSLKTTLELLYKTRSDPGRVFMATSSYDVPEE